MNGDSLPARTSGFRIPPRPQRAPSPRHAAQPQDTRNHPAAIYLASLGTTAGREGMLSALNRAAELLGRGDAASARWDEIRYSDMTLLRTILQEKYAPSTANKVLAAVRGTLRAAWRLGLVDGETYRQATAGKPVRGDRLPQGRALEQGEINALFGELDGSKASDARDGALLALLFGCGLRRAEAAALTSDNVNLEESTLQVLGKGNRERIAHLNQGTQATIENWLKHRGTTAGPLLLQVSRHGLIGREGMSAAAIRLRLQRRASNARLQHCSPHDLRRTYVSMLLDSGADITTVARMAGHQNVQTTSRYDRRGERAAKNAAENLHVPTIRQSNG